jgi:thymidylate kinase
MHDPGDLMTKVYCDILPNATNTCEWYKKKVEMEAGETRHENPSISIWPRFVVSEAKHQGFTFPNNVNLEQSVKMFANRSNYTLPMQCVSPREEQEILETSLEHEKAMVPEFFESPLGEEKLRKGFEQVLKEKKLCSVDAKRVLQDERWLGFFNSVRQTQS